MSLEMRAFGEMPDGTPVQLYTLANGNGLEARITNYGGILVNLFAPDRTGQVADLVLGFDTLEDYVTRNRFFGALVGRYANRIAGGHFTLQGKRYQLAQNGGPNHLHGGPIGFDKVVWRAEAGSQAGQPALYLHYLSPDGDQGYPGALDVQVTYTMTHDNGLQLDYHAKSDAPTILNLTNHSYFNLAGAGEGDILSHLMTLHADSFTPVDDALIPTGEIRPVTGTPFDFRTPTPIGARIDGDDEQLRRGLGYDHNWVIGPADGTLRHTATVEEPVSGRCMTLHTTQPGVQFYTGNMLPDALSAKGGHIYRKRSGFCLETQHFPNSPNRADFPSVVLAPGDVYEHRTVFAFDVSGPAARV